MKKRYILLKDDSALKKGAILFIWLNILRWDHEKDF